MADHPNRPNTLHLNPADLLVVALDDLWPGAPLGPPGVVAAEPIAKGHKVAIAAIGAGEHVRKYGQIIGTATAPISAGRHIHTHNLAFEPSSVDHALGGHRVRHPLLPESDRATFQGIVRADGRVATRNYIGVLPTVNCSATVVRLIADQFRGPDALAGYPNVDGVIALTHSLGCAAAEGSEATQMLRRTIGGYARHPNFAAVIVVGLGCETNPIDRLMAEEGLDATGHVLPFVIQDMGGTNATVRAGVERIRAVLPEVNRVKRQAVSAAHLKLGLQCGGSDGFSGITANPALGYASDLLVANGGTSILSETPEIYGAEHMLLGRAIDKRVGDKLLNLIRWWEAYAEKHGDSLDNNPSPGNKAGGLTTILEKSLGAAAKGGTSDLVEVYRYAETVTKPGFVFMDTPGYDPVSVTGQVAGGANIICFTTGRGSCFGCKPAPSLKLATNTAMFNRMRDDMDINCGEIADGAATIEEMGSRIFAALLATASGQKSKSEAFGYGGDEFAPWHFGATL